jgi:hypothetical protein
LRKRSYSNDESVFYSKNIETTEETEKSMKRGGISKLTSDVTIHPEESSSDYKASEWKNKVSFVKIKLLCPQ